ncbi:MAG: hypothetical protein K2K89_01500 [Ruminococcus sp.]|nr:hypothetical protein [Ruminococcus sp.]
MLNSIDRSTEKGKRDYVILVLMLTSGLRTIEETKQLLRYTNINTTRIYSHALEHAKNSEERQKQFFRINVC